jgi:RNA polymerase sigma factor (sigma-70 family)
MSKWTEFFRRERSRLVRYVGRLIDDAADREAEDIVQDVMLGVFDRADITIPIENLSAYIYQAIRNKIVDIFRKKKQVIPLPDEVRDAGSSTEDVVEKKELVDYVHQAIDSLSPESRAVVIATEFEGRTFRELSEEWNIPIGTLLARKSRALQQMRDKLTGLV